MSKKDTFNWDEYLESTPYKQVLDGMRPARLIIPTMFSPDKKLLYLKSHDIDVSTEDPEQLKKMFDATCSDLEHEAKIQNTSFEKLYIHQIDYLMLWHLLRDLDVKLPEEHEIPEVYLQKVKDMIPRSA